MAETPLELVCPKCNHFIDKDTYHNLINYARGAVKYGYKYRTIYEQDDKEGKTGKYSIELSEVWTFLALAALSGVIGNVAHDIIKQAFALIIKNAKSSPTKKLRLGKFIEFEDPEQYDLFMCYIQEYCEGYEKSNIKAEIKLLINEELENDIHTQLILKFGHLKPGQTIDARITLHVITQKVAGIKPHNKTFDSFWVGTPKTDEAHAANSSNNNLTHADIALLEKLLLNEGM